MAVGYITEQNLQISRGLIRGAYSVNKFGYNSAVPSNAYETIWDGSNLYTYISSAGTATVTSSNTSSDNGGTVTVYGLDANYDLVQETLTIGSGAGTQSFYRVFRATLDTANTGTANVGTVTVTVDSTSAAIISPTRGQSLMAIYTIPRGKKGYLVQLDAGSQKDLEHEVQLVVKNGSGNVWQTKDFVSIRGGFNAKTYALPVEIDEKYDIEVRAKSSATSAVSAGFELIVLDVPRTMQVSGN